MKNLIVISSIILSTITSYANNPVVYNVFNREQTINVVARTLYGEARGEGKCGMYEVANVIYNRAGGHKDYLAFVCLSYKQFSCWNKDIDYKNKKSKHTAMNYKCVNPKTNNKNEEKAWGNCVMYATELYDGKFVSTSKNNSYHTTSVNPCWSKTMKNSNIVGNHKFGYLKEHDGSKRYM